MPGPIGSLLVVSNVGYSACSHKGPDTTEAIKHTWPHVNTREGMPQLRDDDVL